MKRHHVIAMLVGVAIGLTIPACGRQQESQGEGQGQVQRWEYKVYDPGEAKEHSKGAIEKDFNALGADGWEYAGFTGGLVTFKRPKK